MRHLRKKIYIVILNITRAGGTERAVVNLSNSLIRYYDVTILSLLSNNKENSYFEINCNIKIKHLNIYDIPFNSWKKLKWMHFVYKKICHYITPDAIVLGTGHNINVILPFLKKVKTIACEHIQLDSISQFHQIAMKLIYPLNDALVVLSENSYNKYKRFNKNIFIIPNALSFIPKFPSILTEKRIIMVGRLSAEKGYDRVVEIAQNIAQNHPDWKIHIFGSGSMKNKLESLYAEKNINKLITIHQPVKNIQNEYLGSSIYLMTSYNEALPMVILEAKSCGLPVVAYECEGTKSLIKDGYDGFLIPNNNANLLIERMNYLIINYDKRKEMGNNALNSCIPYSSNNILNKWQNLLETI